MNVKALLGLVLWFAFAGHASAQLACTRFYPAGIGQVGIYNNCSRCMTAAMAWCDGTIHRANVPANSGITISTCIGAVTLVGESPCSGRASPMKSQITDTPSIKPTAKEGVSNLISRNRVTTQMISGATPASSSCSAHNDVGDTCTISCPEGQAAQCFNAAGAGTPQCQCK